VNPVGGQCYAPDPYGLSTCVGSPCGGTPGFTVNHCQSNSFGFAGCALEFPSFTCGCYSEGFIGYPYFKGGFGSEHLMAYISLDVLSGNTTDAGDIIAYRLDNLQILKLDRVVAGVGNVSMTITLTPFNIPNSGLAGVGGFVGDTLYRSGPYVVSGMDTRSTTPPVNTPLWYCSVDKVNYQYDRASFEANVKFISNGECTSGTHGGHWNANVNRLVLKEDMALVYKLNNFYTYSNFSDVTSRMTLKPSGLITLEVTAFVEASGVSFVNTESDVIILNVTSVYTCLDGEASFWVYSRNVNSPGLATLMLYESNRTVALGSYFFASGYSNISVAYPFQSLVNSTVCSLSLRTSCKSFVATCISPYNPYPSPSPSNGGSSGSGLSLFGFPWYYYLVIALVLVAVVVVILILCKCFYRIL